MVNFKRTPSKKVKKLKNNKRINGPFFSCTAEFSAGWQHYCSRHLVVKVGDELRHHEAENDGVVALHVRVGDSCQYSKVCLKKT
jgi:hypothetical protein